MRSQAEQLMTLPKANRPATRPGSGSPRKSRFAQSAAAAAWRTSAAILSCAAAASAQDDLGPRDIDVPNPMGFHTWFIILAGGAFLAWCISYCLQLQKESLQRKPRRSDYLRQKEQILDRLAELETQLEQGVLSKERYDREFRKGKSRLSQVLSRLARDGESTVEH